MVDDPIKPIGNEGPSLPQEGTLCRLTDGIWALVTDDGRMFKLVPRVANDDLA